MCITWVCVRTADPDGTESEHVDFNELLFSDFAHLSWFHVHGDVGVVRVSEH